MDPRKLFHDERLNASCAYCGRPYSTKDHVPAKVFLDEPYPDALAVVDSCEPCNNGASEDELYLACLLDCVISGSTDPDRPRRDRIARALRERPGLRERMTGALTRSGEGELVWVPDAAAVKRVLLKLARGHVAYDLSDPRIEEPDCIREGPLVLMSKMEREAFENPPPESGWPEIGSRAFIRDALVFGGEPVPRLPWVDVQPDRYRYATSYGDGLIVRIVLSEYLACEVRWS